VRGEWQPGILYLSGVGADRPAICIEHERHALRAKSAGHREPTRRKGQLRWTAYNHGFIEAGLVDPGSEADVFTTYEAYVMDTVRASAANGPTAVTTLDTAR